MPYIDEDTGLEVITHSMVTSMRMCPQQFRFRYEERLKPRRMSLPLKRGSWLHSLLEGWYRDGDWETPHAELTAQFNELFDEERERLGDLPGECARIMRSYLWHYRESQHKVWKVLEVEKTYECELPDGRIYRAKIDTLVEDEFGLAIVDHKSHKRLPDFEYRLRDSQSLLYLWCLRKNGIEVNRFIWNYLRTKAPSVPQLLKDGTRLSRRAIETDYPTARRAIDAYGLRITRDIHSWLLGLQSQRFDPNHPQTSPFFRRERIEVNDDRLERMAISMIHTADRIREYPWDQPDAVERVVGGHCQYRCSYSGLCSTEIFGGNADQVRRLDYRVGDPLDYYQDQKDRAEN
jgi:PD-(D/E)XK nuclease superfamily protein